MVGNGLIDKDMFNGITVADLQQASKTHGSMKFVQTTLAGMAFAEVSTKKGDGNEAFLAKVVAKTAFDLAKVAGAGLGPFNDFKDNDLLMEFLPFQEVENVALWAYFASSAPSCKVVGGVTTWTIKVMDGAGLLRKGRDALNHWRVLEGKVRTDVLVKYPGGVVPASGTGFRDVILAARTLSIELSGGGKSKVPKTPLVFPGWMLHGWYVEAACKGEMHDAMRLTTAAGVAAKGAVGRSAHRASLEDEAAAEKGSQPSSRASHSSPPSARPGHEGAAAVFTGNRIAGTLSESTSHISDMKDAVILGKKHEALLAQIQSLERRLSRAEGIGRIEEARKLESQLEAMYVHSEVLLDELLKLKSDERASVAHSSSSALLSATPSSSSSSSAPALKRAKPTAPGLGGAAGATAAVIGARAPTVAGATPRPSVRSPSPALPATVAGATPRPPARSPSPAPPAAGAGAGAARARRLNAGQKTEDPDFDPRDE